METRTSTWLAFSRGSALALGFVNKINDDGIQENGATVVQRPRVRFLSLFDVMSAFGPAALGGPFAHLQPLHKWALPDNVEYFHAIALDERRFSFVVTRLVPTRCGFRGVHCDIGGSNNDLSLSNIALRWMWRKTMLCGLPITVANLNPKHDGCAPSDPINPAPACRAEKFFWRTVLAPDLIHYTVAQHAVLPDEACNPNVPTNAPIETKAFEETRRDLPGVVRSGR